MAKDKDENAQQASNVAELELVREAKLSGFVGEAMEGRCAANGVRHRDGLLYIVFDRRPHIACLTIDLTVPEDRPVLVPQRGEKQGYEDLVYEPHTRRWLCLVEASEQKGDGYRTRIEEYDETLRFIQSNNLDYVIKAKRGMAGLSLLRYKDEEYLVGLCGGNACKSGPSGREPGKGRLQLFRHGMRRWEHVGTIKLPRSMDFSDFTGLDFCGPQAAVVSTEASAVWVGRLKAEPGDLSDVWEDEGRIYEFPRDKKNRPLYCNLRGVTWIGESMLAAVSDRSKNSDQRAACVEKEESVHIFRLP